jgi:small neutral amino acid transporter SnatA (MarC family)
VSATLLLLLVAVNPVAVAAELRSRVDRRVLAAGLVTTVLLAVALAAASEAVLDVLSVTAPTFRVAAGAVLLLASAVWLVRGPRLLPPEDGLLNGDRSGLVVPLLLPVLVSPQLVMVSITAGADEGVVALAVGVAVAVGLSGAASLLHRGREGLWSVAVRFSALPAAVVAAGLIVDGVKTV